MGIRRVCLRLALLAVLFAADATASTPDADLLTGEIQLAFLPYEISALPIDVQALAESTCGGITEKIGPLGRCRLKVVTDSGGGTVKVVVPTNRTGTLQLVQWQATHLDLAGAEPVETSCGVWDVWLSLDALQPVSSIILDADDPGRGSFASVLEMSVRLHLANRATGHVVAYPMRLRLGLAGPWMLTSPDDDPTQSNLFLLAGWEGHCFPVWVLVSGEYLGQFVTGHCQFCLKAVRPSAGTVKR